MTDAHIEIQQGHGTLRSRVFPKTQFDVEYCIKRQPKVQAIAEAPHVSVLLLGQIDYIRSLQGEKIAPGQYDLEISADGTTEILGVQNRADHWDFLPV